MIHSRFSPIFFIIFFSANVWKCFVLAMAIIPNLKPKNPKKFFISYHKLQILAIQKVSLFCFLEHRRNHFYMENDPLQFLDKNT
jgi:hypothetical protein